MRRILLTFFFVLSIALISSPALSQMQQGRIETESDTSMDKGHKGEIDLESWSGTEHKTADWKDYNVHDPGVTILELVQLKDVPVLSTPGEKMNLTPDKFDTVDPDIDTKVTQDTTPTCDQIFLVIDRKQKAGVPLSWYDQAMRARCIDQPKPEDDDELDEPRDDFYSLQYPETDFQEEGKLTRIEWRFYKTCCPEVRIVCPSCSVVGRGNTPSSSQSVSSSQSTNQGSSGNSVSTAANPSQGNSRNTRQVR
jgi:hypothetical protein